MQIMKLRLNYLLMTLVTEENLRYFTKILGLIPSTSRLKCNLDQTFLKLPLHIVTFSLLLLPKSLFIILYILQCLQSRVANLFT